MKASRPTSGAGDGPPIERPLFVVGTGRSGLTPLMDLIAYHEAFAWPTQYNDRWPGLPPVSRLSRVVEVPVLRGRAKFLRGVPRHAETYRLWGRCFGGFPEPFRDLEAEDATPLVRRRFHEAVRAILRHHGKPRFIAEYSGWSRIAFLRAVFPDARFIHIVRDGRAVAHSLLSVPWWDGWGGVHRWRIGIPGPQVMERLERHGHSFVALAAAYWAILVSNIDDRGRRLPEDDFLTVRYEDLVADPEKEARRCVAFAGLDPDRPAFLRHLRTVRVVDANREQLRIPPWREAFDRRDLEVVEDVAGDELARFGYL
ncbi:MAG TPA: sulfotransferase [Actinomycetota bacterium]|nr:sulfotransferase [Actinomycetota bacterium]